MSFISQNMTTINIKMSHPDIYLMVVLNGGELIGLIFSSAPMW